MATQSGRLVILSGPSCVGKSPLEKALARFHPDLHQTLRPLVLFNSRAPRPGEKDGSDYHFRSRAEIESLRRSDRYVVMDVRGDLQALDLDALQRDLAVSDVLFEGNPFVGATLLTQERLTSVERLSVFMSPLSHDELAFLTGPDCSASADAVVADVMRRKLLRRTSRQKGHLSLRDLEEVERRAGSAYRELALAHHFEHIIVNHDGEDSENWDAFYYLLGDARRAMVAMVELLRTGRSAMVEQWEEGFPGPFSSA